jgi:hypothetical protein
MAVSSSRSVGALVAGLAAAGGVVVGPVGGAGGHEVPAGFVEDRGAGQDLAVRGLGAGGPA